MRQVRHFVKPATVAGLAVSAITFKLTKIRASVTNIVINLTESTCH